MLNKTLFQ